jgi:NADP-dependent 3-hydroxy acid dehydrogenase YdfG
MSGRVLLVEGSGVHDIFEVVELTDTLARVRSPYLFEIGEELKVKVERNSVSREHVARVVAHAAQGPADAKVTELELTPV